MADVHGNDLGRHCGTCGKPLVPHAAHDNPIWTSGDGRDMPEEPRGHADERKATELRQERGRR